MLLMNQVLDREEMKQYGAGCHYIPLAKFKYASCLLPVEFERLARFCNEAREVNDEQYVVTLWVWCDKLDCPIVIQMSFVSQSKLKGFVRC